MAHVVNTLNSDGQFVILGDALTLPTSNASNAASLLGSLRFNPSTNAMEVLLPGVNANPPVWTAVATGSGGGGGSGSVSAIQPTGAFYEDRGASIVRLNDRLLVGDATLNRAQANRDATPTDRLSAILANTAIGAWPVYGAQFASGAVFGSIGVLGYATTADAASAGPQLGYVPPSIGLAGFAVNDDTSSATTTSAFAIYGHALRMVGANTRPTFAAVLEVANYGGTPIDITSPYTPNIGGGTYNLQLGSGGGDATTTTSTEAAIVLVRNPTTHNKGIVFAADSLTGTDGSVGSSGYASAIALARTQAIEWYAPSGQMANYLRSVTTDPSYGSRVEFQDNAVMFLDADGAENFGVQNGGSVVLPKAGASIELGSSTIANAPYIDFHSSGGSQDYDARIVASGGSVSTLGQADLDIIAGRLLFNGVPLATTSDVNTAGFDGTFIAPMMTTTGYNIVLTAGDVNSPNPGISGGNMLLTAGASVGYIGFGGPMTLQGGTGVGGGGAVSLIGGTVTGDGIGANGGNVVLCAGGAQNASQAGCNSGSVSISTPNAPTGGYPGGSSGGITITTGDSSINGRPGGILLQAGNADDRTGWFNSPGGAIGLTTGHGAQTNGPGGDLTVTLGSGTGTGRQGLLIVNTLPTVDPGVTGALWTLGGAVVVSGTTSLATAPSLSSLTAAVAANTIASGDNAQTWQWALASASKTAFTIGESAASTNAAAGNTPALANTQYLLGIATQAGSTAGPLQVSVGTFAIMTIAASGSLSYQPPAHTAGNDNAAGLSLLSANYAGSGTANSGSILIQTGDSNYAVGGLTLQGGAGTAPTVKGGTVSLLGGAGHQSSGVGGDIAIQAGPSQGLNGGAVSIQSGQGGYSSGGLSIATPNSAGYTGSLTLSTGTATNGNDAGSIALNAGSATNGGVPGSINLTAGDQTSTSSGSFSDRNGGGITLTTGHGGFRAGHGGDFTLNLGARSPGGTGRQGLIIVAGAGLPTSDPGVTNAVWASNGVLAVSGFTFTSGSTAQSANMLTTARNIALAGDATGSVPFDGSANATISATLAATGVIPGTYTQVVVNAKGLITSASAPTNTATATKLATARTIALAGDATGSVLFDGSANATISAALAASGVTAGTYTVSTIVVDTKGRITSAASGTATGAVTGAMVDYSCFLNATTTSTSTPVALCVNNITNNTVVPYSQYAWNSEFFFIDTTGVAAQGGSTIYAISQTARVMVLKASDGTLTYVADFSDAPIVTSNLNGANLSSLMTFSLSASGMTASIKSPSQVGSSAMLWRANVRAVIR